jgi:TolB-like protein/tetratricopeptide (TPR) repeat protein
VAERRLAAIMFTDIVGYAALMARDEEAGRRARDRHEAVVRPLVERYGGQWIERTGDETLSSFPSALDAVNCALAAQAELDGDADLQLRIGIHQGDVTFDVDGVAGSGVNVASRVRPHAEPGGIAISDDVHASVQGQRHLEFKSLGPQDLKHVPRRVTIYAASGESEPAPPLSKAARGVLRPALRSIAVLPLEHLGNPEHEYVADGVTDALIESLARIGPELLVISRTSVKQYKGTTKTAREIASELGVEFLMEGTAQRQDERVLIRVQLIEARADAHRWAQSYEGDVRDFFGLQREIARAVAGEVSVALVPEVAAPRPDTRRLDPTALDLHLRAMSLRASSMFGGYPSSLQAAIELEERAVALDPDFAEGWASLAMLFLQLELLFRVATATPDGRARDAAERALQIDDRLAGAHAALGGVRLWFDWDFGSAHRALERALELSPNDPAALLGQVLYLDLVGSGRSPRADHLLDRLLRVAPLDIPLRAHRMAHFSLTGRHERAIRELEHIRQFHPGFVDWRVVDIYLRLNRPEDALREALATSAGGSVSIPDFDLAPLREAFQRGIEDGDWQRAVRVWIQTDIDVSADSWDVPIACRFALLGDGDQAIAWLEHAYENRNPQLLAARVEPLLDPLRSDPRFQDLLRRIGFPES